MKDKFCLRTSIGLASAGVGLGILGNKLSSSGVVSTEVSNGLSGAGVSFVSFVSPAINISMGGYMVNQLRNIGRCCRR